MKKILIIGLLFGISILLVYCFDKPKNYVKTSNIYISEIVSHNGSIIEDSDHEYSDYLEIYNGNSYDINLKNYRLTDNLGNSTKWVFPDFIIKSGEYKVIFASKKNRCEEECHLNFKLSRDGETITLIDPTGTVINRVHYPKLNTNTSYSFVKNDYKVVLPTPGKENVDAYVEEVDLSKYKLLYINEYLSHNDGVSYAPNGGYYDWIELYNKGDSELNLKGFNLSDDIKKLNKYIFPDTTIKSGEYKVIYLTGGECGKDMLCANFKLSDNDSKIVLSVNENILDSVEVVKLDKNMSYGRGEDKWLYYFLPTPGRANQTNGVERWDNNGSSNNLSS